MYLQLSDCIHTFIEFIQHILGMYGYQAEVSHIGYENYKYVKYNPETGETDLWDSEPSFGDKQFYRKIHNSSDEKLRYKPKRGEMFVDKDYSIRQSDLMRLSKQEGQDVISKRLLHLYPKKNRFPFFTNQQTDKPFEIQNRQSLFFLTEVNLFPVIHYRTFFITANYDEYGRYLLVINDEGKFHLEVVDDFVPVYKKTDEPLWTRDLQNPWLMILLKAWAKIKGGYARLLDASPMDFLKKFSNSNWKYFNVAKQPKLMLRYLPENDGKIVLKTKNNPQIRHQGLQPKVSAYELMAVRTEEHEDSNIKGSKHKSKVSLIALIRSTVPVQWKGKYCYANKQAHKILNSVQDRSGLTLQKSFIVSEKEFYNLFSNAHVTSIRKHALMEYLPIDVPAGTKKALFLEFDIHRDGFLDFSFQQVSSNKRHPNRKSMLTHQNASQSKVYQSNISQSKVSQSNFQGSKIKTDDNSVKRYQKCKYMIVRDMHSQSSEYGESNSLNEKYSERDETFKNWSQSYHNAPSRSFQQFREGFESQHNPLRYYCIEYNYFKGYSKGQGQFYNLQKGKYILRFKPQQSIKDTKFYLNYTSDQKIHFTPIEPNEKQKNEIMRQAIISISKNIQSERKPLSPFVSGDYFERMGYGFVTILSPKDNKQLYKVQVDPEEMKKYGIALGKPFADKAEPFGVLVQPGECATIIMKRFKVTDNEWPFSAITFMKK